METVQPPTWVKMKTNVWSQFIIYKHFSQDVLDDILDNEATTFLINYMYLQMWIPHQEASEDQCHI